MIFSILAISFKDIYTYDQKLHSILLSNIPIRMLLSLRRNIKELFKNDNVFLENDDIM